MYQRMTTFAFLRMTLIIVLMMTNHGTDAHTIYTLTFSVFSNKNKNTEVYSQPKNTHNAF